MGKKKKINSKKIKEKAAGTGRVAAKAVAIAIVSYFIALVFVGLPLATLFGNTDRLHDGITVWDFIHFEDLFTGVPWLMALVVVLAGPVVYFALIPSEARISFPSAVSNSSLAR